MLLPSDVARLVLGYLQQEKLASTCSAFIAESPNLKEYAEHYTDEGFVPGCLLSLFGKNLTAILNEYVSMKAKETTNDVPLMISSLWKKLEFTLSQIRSMQNSAAFSANQRARTRSAIADMRRQKTLDSPSTFSSLSNQSRPLISRPLAARKVRLQCALRPTAIPLSISSSEATEKQPTTSIGTPRPQMGPHSASQIRKAGPGSNAPPAQPSTSGQQRRTSGDLRNVTTTADIHQTRTGQPASDSRGEHMATATRQPAEQRLRAEESMAPLGQPRTNVVLFPPNATPSGQIPPVVPQQALQEVLHLAPAHGHPNDEVVVLDLQAVDMGGGQLGLMVVQQPRPTVGAADTMAGPVDDAQAMPGDNEEWKEALHTPPRRPYSTNTSPEQSPPHNANVDVIHPVIAAPVPAPAPGLAPLPMNVRHNDVMRHTRLFYNQLRRRNRIAEAHLKSSKVFKRDKCRRRALFGSQMRAHVSTLHTDLQALNASVQSFTTTLNASLEAYTTTLNASIQSLTTAVVLMVDMLQTVANSIVNAHQTPGAVAASPSPSTPPQSVATGHSAHSGVHTDDCGRSGRGRGGALGEGSQGRSDTHLMEGLGARPGSDEEDLGQDQYSQRPALERGRGGSRKRRRH